jgi:hypothetical protein
MDNIKIPFMKVIDDENELAKTIDLSCIKAPQWLVHYQNRVPHGVCMIPVPILYEMLNRYSFDAEYKNNVDSVCLRLNALDISAEASTIEAAVDILAERVLNEAKNYYENFIEEYEKEPDFAPYLIRALIIADRSEIAEEILHSIQREKI